MTTKERCKRCRELGEVTCLPRLTRRDEFAKAAMQALLTENCYSFDEAIEHAMGIADRMIERLDRNEASKDKC